MTILAGQIVTAGQLNRMQPVVYYAQAGSGTTFTTTTFADVANCSIDLNTSTAARYTVQANFSWDQNAATASIYTRGVLNIDGVVQSGEARWSEGSSGLDGSDFDMSGKGWSGTLIGGGAHNFKLQVALNAAGSVISTGFTDITVVIYEVV